MKIAIIILAAGNSSRLGQPKQLLLRGNQSMIHYIQSECIKAQLGDIYIVTGAYHTEIVKEINPAHVLYHENWKGGLSTSITFGVESIDKDVYDGVIIVLSDQVFLTSDILTQLALKAKTSSAKIVNCQYQNGMGPPTYFDKRLFPELENLTGDDGAKVILQKYATERTSIEFPRGNIDIDTEADIEILRDI